MLFRSIYSDSYFSYHYGYKKLKSHSDSFSSKSKILKVENDLFEYFQDIHFQIIFLNYSRRGVFINFIANDHLTKQQEERLGIKPFGNARSFTIPFKNNQIKHREIYSLLRLHNLNDFDISKNAKNKIKEIFTSCDARFFCLGFDVSNQNPNLNDLHLEIYPKKNIYSCEKSLDYLQICGCRDRVDYEKYFYDFSKFSHIKFRLLNGKIKNIKYYRSINVQIPKFYNE